MQRLFSFLFFTLVLALVSCDDTVNSTRNMTHSSFDWQGHRGARGLLPENSIPAFLKALEFPAITTLELDVAVSRDSLIIISHEPWFSEKICAKPDGEPVGEEEAESLRIYEMTYEEIQGYDCGSRGHPGYPEQEPVAVHKPDLREMVAAVRAYCAENDREMPRFNIEIKSRPEWDGVYTPPVEAFARLLLAEIEELDIHGRTCVQSFDMRALRAVRGMDSTLVTAFLTEHSRPVAESLAELGYTPEIYSPYYPLVTANLVKVVHEHGMKLIPWTVNETETMEMLIGLGVDGIITDYPDRIPPREE